MILAKPKYCNCLFWALYMKLKYGWEIKSVHSEHGWWRHYYYIHEGVAYEYVPLEPSDDLVSPPPIFRGYPRIII